VITTIGLDHVKTLGNNLQIIAHEKAGIIKSHIPLVLGNIEEAPQSVILEKAMAKAAPVFLFGKDWKVEVVSDDTAGICFDYRFQDIFIPNIKANLMGEHQAENLGVAITAFILYCQKHKIHFDELKVRKALQSINWAGRMQVLRHDPTVIVDGAHNVHGVRALIATLDKVYPEQALNFVISILADKDYSEMIPSSAKKQTRYSWHKIKVTVPPVRKINCARFQTQGSGSGISSVAEAYQNALAETGREGVLVAGGSLYTVGEIISVHNADA
jgi:dihydrofolate synthase/folylpolyglutamate synthase